MSGESLPGSPCSRFSESHAPPPWLRVLLWGFPVAWVGYWAFAEGADAAAGAAAGAVIVLFATASLEISQALYGGICVDETHLRVGRRRSVALADLDLETLRFEAGMEIHDVFGKRNVKSNPMWLPHTVALEGRDERGTISVVVKTRRPDELVAALRTGVTAAREA